MARLAEQIPAPRIEIADLGAAIEARFREHRHAEVILSIPKIGPVLGADFVAFSGGDIAALGSHDRLAGVAGLAPWTPAGSAAPCAARGGIADGC